MFTLRAKVFAQDLGWVKVDGEREVDRYDALNPIYVLHTDASGEILYACGRLMPTSGPTLLADVFGQTLPDINFAAPHVWEITRLCVDDAALRRDGLCDQRMAILRSLHVAALEFGLSAGVETYLANFDPLRQRMWRRMGVTFDVIGRSDAFSVPVLLGVTEVSETVLAQARRRLCQAAPILCKPPHPMLAAA
ncbi:MAG: acyl-homoserine-lactone synthase [Pseudomonadota bacterium]